MYAARHTVTFIITPIVELSGDIPIWAGLIQQVGR